MVGLGIAIAFRGGVINIGAEGQLIVGALLTTYIGLQLGERMNGTLVIVIGLLAGMLMGGIWGAIPGYLKAQLGVNEILSTIMMNQIAIQIGYYLLRGPMIDPAELAAGTNIPTPPACPKPSTCPASPIWPNRWASPKRPANWICKAWPKSYTACWWSQPGCTAASFLPSSWPYSSTSFSGAPPLATASGPWG